MRIFRVTCYTILVSLLAGLFSLTLSAQSLDKIVAIVNDDIVLESELASRVASIVEQWRAQGRPLPDLPSLQQQILERLILDSIQLQLADTAGIRVSDRELNEAMESIAAQNNLSVLEFRNALQATGQDFLAVREDIRRELLLRQVQQTFVNRRIQISDQEVENYLNSEAGQSQNEIEVNLSNILIPIASQSTAEEIEAAKALAEQVYQDLLDGADFADMAQTHSAAPNAASGGVLGWRALNQLPEHLSSGVRLLQASEISAPIFTTSGIHILKVNERRGGGVTLVEETRARHILLSSNAIRSEEQTQLLAEDLYTRIEREEPFDELARLYSDDPVSGSLGGDLGWVQPGQMVPEFEAVMQETAVGAVSEPFESRFGWHIVQVQERRMQDMTEEMLSTMARNVLGQRKFESELDHWLREIRAQAYVEKRLESQPLGGQ